MNSAARQLAREIGRGNRHLARGRLEVGRRPAGYRSKRNSWGRMKKHPPEKKSKGEEIMREGMRKSERRQGGEEKKGDDCSGFWILIPGSCILDPESCALDSGF